MATDDGDTADMSATRLRVGFVALLCAVVVAGGIPTVGAAGHAITDGGVSPDDVTTGETTSFDVTLDVTEVNTSDGTTGASVTVAFPEAVDLSSATASAPSVTPNATDATASVDAATNAVVVEWNDSTGVDAETLSVGVTVDDATVGRTGTHTVTASADADADGTAEVDAATVDTVTATADGSDRSVGGESAKVYFGETDVDVTGLVGASPAGESQRFYGVSGDAEGTIASVDDTSAVDVSVENNFETGSYNLSSSGGAKALTVSSPSVTDVSLYTGTGTGGADVTDGSFPNTDVSTLTVEASYNFDDAEDASVTVVDEDGLDITEEVASTTLVTASGGTVTLDVSDLDTGTYNVTVEGADDLDDASATASFTVRDEEKTISASKTTVTRGDNTIVTASGTPGETRYVRIDGDALVDGEEVNGAVAKRLFNETDQVAFVGADADANYLYAAVALDDDGFANVRVQTRLLETGTHELELASDATAPDTEDSVSVTVVERTVEVTGAPDTAVVGETITLNGTAAESDTVKLYAKVDSEYLPLYADAEDDELAEADVNADGSWETDVDTRAVLDLTDTYRLVAVGDPGTHAGSASTLDEDTFETFDVTGATTLRTVTGDLSATVVPTEIAATGEDEVVVEGTALGQGDTVRLYIVNPRGEVGALDIDVDDGTFTEEFEGVEMRGIHRVLVVAPGRDGAFAFADGGDATAIASELSGSETQAQAVERIREAYTDAGVDDVVLEGGLRAASPSLQVDDVTTDGQLPNETVTVSGTSNREDGTDVSIEVLDGTDTVATGQATVNGSTGRWETTLDLSPVESGSYTLRAEDDETADRLAFELVDSVTTATPEATATDTPTEAPDDASTETATTTTAASTETATAATQSQTTTTTDVPGFGPVVVVAAVLLLGVVARRRR